MTNHLIAGDTLTHDEDGGLLTWRAAIPTIGMGAIHLLEDEAGATVLAFAAELDAYTHTHRGGETVAPQQAVTATGLPVGLDPKKLDRLLILLEAQAGSMSTEQSNAGVSPTQPSIATPASSPSVGSTGRVPDAAQDPAAAERSEFEQFKAWKQAQEGAPVAPGNPNGPITAPTPTATPQPIVAPAVPQPTQPGPVTAVPAPNLPPQGIPQ